MHCVGSVWFRRASERERGYSDWRELWDGLSRMVIVLLEERPMMMMTTSKVEGKADRFNRQGESPQSHIYSQLAYFGYSLRVEHCPCSGHVTRAQEGTLVVARWVGRCDWRIWDLDLPSLAQNAQAFPSHWRHMSSCNVPMVACCSVRQATLLSSATPEREVSAWHRRKGKL